MSHENQSNPPTNRHAAEDSVKRLLTISIIARIVVDTSVLEDDDSSIRIKDLVLGEGVSHHLDPEHVVVKIGKQYSAERAAAAAAAAAAGEGEEAPEAGAEAPAEAPAPAAEASDGGEAAEEQQE